MRTPDRDFCSGTAIALALSMLAGVAITLGAALLVWLIGHIDWQAAQDFAAPTAAQARDAGWVAISENPNHQEVWK
ncbi:hypothetical protein [Paracoccus versutus]|uniref:Uncharacterized protein n=1 Tax=Paracoccus versutus TaxID=34007 RepID=A0A3D9XRS8_PARVE|nr:hypothetical protein [Paracoccus versutus]REF69619.1 hypothetical protein BDD41_2329 [Paracoccus versutus]WGR58008.1 hypothetical protein E3U25_18905 [Paracoccus versutus]SFY20584.1 hypothetical protein SAMN04244548_03076 [Paracoccus pantotrophus]